jgi:2-furoyl-CoA dehydrogenase FAD binding subunit
VAVLEPLVKPGKFDYIRAESLSEVHAVLAVERGDARVLAGGQTLVPMLSMRFARPKVLIDIMRIPALTTIETQRGIINIGAGVRQAELMTWLDRNPGAQPLLSAAMPFVGHAQTRSRGTVCGSVAHADPSAEIPLVLTALGAAIVLSSKRGQRRVRAEEFFIGPMSTARMDDEIIESVQVPSAQQSHGYAFREFARRHGDFAIVACAAVAGAHSLRLAIGGVGDRPVARDIGELYGDTLDQALDAFAYDLEARDDLHATARYRRELVRQLGRQTIDEARQCRA